MMRLLTATVLLALSAHLCEGNSEDLRKDACPKRIIRCLYNPCHYTLCSQGTVCVSDPCGRCRAECVTAPNCTHNGTIYRAGMSFPSTDGCNRCTCGNEGSIRCTDRTCRTCKYSGKEYRVGDSFPDEDGCNRCNCQRDGSISCTQKSCTTCEYNGIVYQEGDTIPTGGNCERCTCGFSSKKTCIRYRCHFEVLYPCFHEGKKIPIGQSFQASDGCNTCTCTRNRTVECTKKTCLACRKSCPHGFVEDQDGRQTCECKTKCGKTFCKSDEICSNGDCCPKANFPNLCFINPCLLKKCPRRMKCETYCGCSARCVWKR